MYDPFERPRNYILETLKNFKLIETRYDEYTGKPYKWLHPVIAYPTLVIIPILFWSLTCNRCMATFLMPVSGSLIMHRPLAM